MKKTIGIIAAAIMVLAAFTGCGEKAAKDAESMVSGAVSDMESGEKSMLDNTTKPTEIESTSESSAESNKNDGTVSDGNGIIGDEDSTDPSDEADTSAPDMLV